MEQIFGKGVSKGVAAGPDQLLPQSKRRHSAHEVSDTAQSWSDSAQRGRRRRSSSQSCMTRHLLRPVRTRQCCSRRTR